MSVTEREIVGDGLVERASVEVTYAQQLLRSVSPGSDPPGVVRGAVPFRLVVHLFRESGDPEWDPGHRPPTTEIATAILGLLRSGLGSLRRS